MPDVDPLSGKEVEDIIGGLTNEEPRRKQRGIKIPETRRIPSAASCGEYDPKRFKLEPALVAKMAEILK